MLQMNTLARTAFEQAIADVGLDVSDLGISIEGEEPEGLSPHWLATAGAVGLAVQGASTAAFWKQRSGRGQQVSVSVGDAMHAICSFLNVQQNGVGADYGTINMALTGYHRTADDRWIMFPAHHNYPHHLDGVLALLDCASTREACARAIAGWQAEDLENALAEHRLPGAFARTREEWLDHPQGRWLADRPVVEVEKIAEGSPEPFPPAPRPLTGLRVLDMTHVIGGPMTSRSLAEQGADVLQIGDPRQPDTQWQYLDTLMGKRSAFLNLTNDAHLQRLRELAAETDVFVQSWRPGSLEKFGVTPAELARQRPGIIYVSLSCYGMGGPWASRGGYDPNAQAVSGVAMVEGGEGPPSAPATSTINDYLVAFFGVAGVMSALMRRAREGGSYHVRVSLTRTSMWLQSFGLKPGWKGRPEISPVSVIPARHIVTQTSFGEVRNLAPAIRYSDTPAYWERALEPFGASRPEWLPREILA